MFEPSIRQVRMPAVKLTTFHASADPLVDGANPKRVVGKRHASQPGPRLRSHGLDRVARLKLHSYTTAQPEHSQPQTENISKRQQ
jgi:hypothetical protein